MEVQDSAGGIWPAGRKAAFFTIFIIFSSGLLDYTDRMIVASLFPFLKEAWGLSDAQLGLIPMALNLSVGMLAVPCGMLIDRWSRKKMIFIMGGIWALACGACKLAGGLNTFLMARVCGGAGEATYNPVGQALIAAQVPERYRGTAVSIANLGVCMGAPAGFITGSFIAARYGWHSALGLMLVPGIILAVLALFIRDFKTKEKVPGNSDNRPSYKEVFAEVLRTPSLCLLYAGVVFMGTVLGIGISWMPTYFQRIAHLSVETSGLVSGGIFLGSPIGVLILGPVLDALKKRHANAPALVLTAIALAATVINVSAYGLVQPGSMLQVVLLISSGMCLGTFPAASIIAVIGVANPAARATAGALLVSILNLIAVPMGGYLTGLLSDFIGLGRSMLIMHSVSAIALLLFLVLIGTYARDSSRYRNAGPDFS